MVFRKKQSSTLMESAAELADQVRPKIESAVETAREKLGPVVAEAREKAGPALADAREQAAVQLADAREKAGPALADAREKAAEQLADAKKKAAPVIAEGRKGAAKKAASGKAMAAAGLATIAPGMAPQKKKGGRLKKVLLLGGLLAIGGVVFKKLRGDRSQSNWQSSYTPSTSGSAGTVSDSPAAGSAAAAASASADDAGAASPDEALSDAAAGPHVDTTPDAPAEVVDLPVQENQPEYGDGAARSNPGGGAPDASYTIKGVEKSQEFHTPGSPSYDGTVAEVWFQSEEAAEAHGFSRAGDR